MDRLGSRHHHRPGRGRPGADAGHNIHLHRAAAPTEFADVRASVDRRFHTR
jgi:hypothetical protein